MINKLEKKVLATNALGYVTLNDTGDEVKLKDLLRALFFRKARVSHIESFLSKILIHTEENLIKNEKLIKLLNDEKSIKPEYDSHTDDHSGELFQDTLENST